MFDASKVTTAGIEGFSEEGGREREEGRGKREERERERGGGSEVKPLFILSW